jgi:hypothetical protein
MASNAELLRAPFPWFGGKSRVAELTWRRFGDCANYVEPFAGSLACLLGRPHWPWDGNRIETVNDADCYLANFWRALQCDPESVADYCDWPVNEADLHARHLWLVNSAKATVAKLRTDPDFYDAKIAGWWVWGLCQWIGSGWCADLHQKLPHLGRGRGVHRPSQQLPHLGSAGSGVHRPSQKRPLLGRGRGVHRPSQQLPHLGDAGRGVHDYLALLAQRLHGVRVCCGDWSRVCGKSPTYTLGTTAVFLDPPYSAEANRADELYAVDSPTVAHDVREWAIANGGNKLLRIALCGYEGEHAMPDDWECVAWKANGGYANRNNDNAHRERIWFSPHCLKPERTKTLF